MTRRNITLLSLSLFLATSLIACEDKAKEKKPEAEATTPKEEAKETTPAKEEAKPQGKDDAAKSILDPGDPESAAVTHAVAVLHPTKDSKVAGTVRFEETDKGIKVITEVSGLSSEGKHAHHIHLFGDCSGDDGKTAGTHFNFIESAKNPPKDIKRITGDLGDLVADKDGNAKGEILVDKATFHGKFSILGRAVIVHEKGNNHEHPPIGAAGGRLACGVIGVTEAN